ncbi:MAG: c-type cytochrome [Pseudomonadales bacterium]|jgi:cytochrome c5|nr:c-type cytochrome [Pseudomonadales bacterium]
MGGDHLRPIAVSGLLLLGACGETPEAPAVAPPPAAVAATEAARLEVALAALTPTRTAEQFARSCAFCHATGNAGAPLVGDTESWAGRAAAGEAAMLRHTLEGLGAMPPLGYCMDCTEDDFRALIRFMVPASLRPEESDA